MRYVSAERTIAAAGAAFACAEDESAGLVKYRGSAGMSGFLGQVRGFFWRALLVTGLVVA